MAEVPLLGLPPLGRAPPDSLLSEAEVLQLIWGHVASFIGYQGIASSCCTVQGRRAICLTGAAGSCGGAEMACLLYKIKERWLNMLGLLEYIGGIIADTTASNFGAWRGSITILQVNLALQSTAKCDLTY